MKKIWDEWNYHTEKKIKIEVHVKWITIFKVKRCSHICPKRSGTKSRKKTGLKHNFEEMEYNMIWWEEASICYGAKTGCLGNRSALLVVWPPLFFVMCRRVSCCLCQFLCFFFLCVYYRLDITRIDSSAFR